MLRAVVAGVASVLIRWNPPRAALGTGRREHALARRRALCPPPSLRALPVVESATWPASCFWAASRT